MQTLNLIAGIAFDPTIRGIRAVGVGVVVLMGSVYLLLATNTGTRLGFLLALTGFFGWMAIMGSIWWIYGIGMQGGPVLARRRVQRRRCRSGRHRAGARPRARRPAPGRRRRRLDRTSTSLN